MTGKIKKLSFTSLFVFISFALIVNSYIFNHFIFISTFLIFFSISLLLTKYGLRIIKKLKLLQNIREDGPSIHLNKKNTPTMGGIFILTPFFILLLTLAKKLTTVNNTIKIKLIVINVHINPFNDEYNPNPIGINIILNETPKNNAPNLLKMGEAFKPFAN